MEHILHITIISLFDSLILILSTCFTQNMWQLDLKDSYLASYVMLVISAQQLTCNYSFICFKYCFLCLNQ